MNNTLPPKPRGIRNNNPGNIRLGQAKWQGQRENGADPAFVEFTAPFFGLRALMRILLTYHRKYGLDTVQSIINRWAPPYENATDHYAYHVARRLNVNRYTVIKIDEHRLLARLAEAIVIHENGRAHKPLPPGWYPSDLYREAALSILKETKQ